MATRARTTPLHLAPTSSESHKLPVTPHSARWAVRVPCTADMWMRDREPIQLRSGPQHAESGGRPSAYRAPRTVWGAPSLSSGALLAGARGRLWKLARVSASLPDDIVIRCVARHAWAPVVVTPFGLAAIDHPDAEVPVLVARPLDALQVAAEPTRLVFPLDCAAVMTPSDASRALRASCGFTISGCGRADWATPALAIGTWRRQAKLRSRGDSVSPVPNVRLLHFGVAAATAGGSGHGGSPFVGIRTLPASVTSGSRTRRALASRGGAASWEAAGLCVEVRGRGAPRRCD